jgi:hypothetical protein
MPAFIPTVRRSFTDRFNALRSDLDSLGQQLRAELAASAGKAVAGAVTDTVHTALGGGRRAPPLPPPSRRNWPQERDRPYWDTSDRRGYDAWSQPSDDPWADRYEPDPDEEPDDDSAPDPSSTPPLRSWVAALCAGCRAAFWWLKRQRGKSPLLTAGPSFGTSPCGVFVVPRLRVMAHSSFLGEPSAPARRAATPLPIRCAPSRPTGLRSRLPEDPLA